MVAPSRVGGPRSCTRLSARGVLIAPSAGVGKQVCAILARHGLLEVRQRGSHIVMQRHIADTTITVPVPSHDGLRLGTDPGVLARLGAVLAAANVVQPGDAVLPEAV